MAVKKMPEIRGEPEQQDFKGRDIFSEKQLNLLHCVVELRHGSRPVPNLLVFLPVAVLIPGWNKVLHKSSFVVSRGALT